jgi:hypothetical protein
MPTLPRASYREPRPWPSTRQPFWPWFADLWESLLTAEMPVRWSNGEELSVILR